MNPFSSLTPFKLFSLKRPTKQAPQGTATKRNNAKRPTTPVRDDADRVCYTCTPDAPRFTTSTTRVTSNTRAVVDMRRTYARGDQTIGPPYSYDPYRKSVIATKQATNGQITVFQMMYRAVDDNRLYWPLDEQSDALGDLIAGLLNSHDVVILHTPR